MFIKWINLSWHHNINIEKFKKYQSLLKWLYNINRFFMLSISLRLPSNMVISQIEHFKRPPLSTHKNIAGDIRRQACGMSISFDRLVSIIKRDKHQSLVPVIYFVVYFFFICYCRIFQFYLLLSYISVLL